MMREHRAKPAGAGRESGVTLIELVCVSAIVLLLASIAIPVQHTLVKARKEIELRQALREMRQAIDRFHQDARRFPGIRQNLLNVVNEEGYPEELEWLYQGVETGDGVTTIKYLRRLPLDPMTGEDDWATRSSRDTPGSLFTDGINIFDVHSKSDAVALDGTRYSDW